MYFVDRLPSAPQLHHVVSALNENLQVHGNAVDLREQMSFQTNDIEPVEFKPRSRLLLVVKTCLASPAVKVPSYAHYLVRADTRILG